MKREGSCQGSMFVRNHFIDSVQIFQWASVKAVGLVELTAY